MQNLHVLTNNHLGNDFWELRTGFFDAIMTSELETQTFQNLLDAKNTFFLVDFYFSGLRLDDEIQMIDEIMETARKSNNQLRLFILSPFFSCTELIHQVSENKVIVSHNFSGAFLRELMMIGKNFNRKLNQA